MSRQYPDEISLLKKIAQAAGPRAEKELRILARGIGDDAALFKPRPGHETILTCDWFLEGTHFLRDMHPPDAVGWKCLARGVSDVAAMGGMPRCFLLSLALPKSHTGPSRARCVLVTPSCGRERGRATFCMSAGGWAKRNWVCNS